jgi:hypothetical protein
MTTCPTIRTDIGCVVRPLLPQSMRISMARRWMRIGQRRMDWAEAIAPEITTDQPNGE